MENGHHTSNVTPQSNGHGEDGGGYTNGLDTVQETVGFDFAEPPQKKMKRLDEQSDEEDLPLSKLKLNTSNSDKENLTPKKKKKKSSSPKKPPQPNPESRLKKTRMMVVTSQNVTTFQIFNRDVYLRRTTMTRHYRPFNRKSKSKQPQKDGW